MGGLLLELADGGEDQLGLSVLFVVEGGEVEGDGRGGDVVVGDGRLSGGEGSGPEAKGGKGGSGTRRRGKEADGSLVKDDRVHLCRSLKGRSSSLSKDSLLSGEAETDSCKGRKRMQAGHS